MSNTQAEIRVEADPFKQWHEMRDAYMKSWAKMMGETVNSEEYAKANGTVLETYLTAFAPFRDAQQKAMLSALEQLNMPSRADFISLADRLSNMELLLDNMDAKLSQIHQLGIAAASRPAPEAKAETKSPEPATSAVVRPTPEAKAETKSPEPATSPVARPAPAAKSETKPSDRGIPAKTPNKGSR
jgi:hypothetical protein